MCLQVEDWRGGEEEGGGRAVKGVRYEAWKEGRLGKFETESLNKGEVAMTAARWA